jgi:uncharacterized RDD family membrane protein YckC
MATMECKKCEHAFQTWVPFCPNCAEPVEGYARPAGFWIRVGAHLVDALIFSPLIILSFWNMLSFKSMTLMVLIHLPGFLYKPLMESFFGATLGKMSCKLKVVNDQCNTLFLFDAYVRSLPFVLSAGIALASQVVWFSSPQFQSVTSFVELGESKQGGYLDMMSTVVSVLVLIDCAFAAFTFRKRALHDMLAESYCVYRDVA